MKGASFCRCGIQFQAFSVSMWKLGLSTEEEFLNGPEWGYSPHQNLSLETWIKKFGWVKLQESQTLV